MNHELTEIYGYERPTAIIHEKFDTGEAYSGPVIVGCITEGEDIWIEREGQRVQFNRETLECIVKQLRRAKKISQEDKTC